MKYLHPRACIYINSGCIINVKVFSAPQSHFLSLLHVYFIPSQIILFYSLGSYHTKIGLKYTIQDKDHGNTLFKYKMDLDTNILYILHIVLYFTHSFHLLRLYAIFQPYHIQWEDSLESFWSLELGTIYIQNRRAEYPT